MSFRCPCKRLRTLSEGIRELQFSFSGLTAKTFSPLRKSKEKGTVIDLLLLTEESEGQQKNALLLDKEFEPAA